MKQHLTKPLAIILLIAMLFTAMPLTSFAATHDHPGYNSAYWTVWNGKTTLYEGYYYLEDDIELSSTVIISNSASVYLCLNGHTITCEDTAFSVYSYSSLNISDCTGTGKVETASKTESYADTILNNGFLQIHDSTIINSNNGGNAIYTCASAATYVYDSTIESLSRSALYKDVNSDVYVYDSKIHGGDCAISGHGDDSGKVGSLIIDGGTFSSDNTYTCINLVNGDVEIRNGIINGGVYLYDPNGTTKITGGTINGTLSFDSKTIITGGEINADHISFYGDTSISGGKFKCADNFLYYPSDYMLRGANNVISGGDFTGCKWVTIAGKTSISSGTFNNVYVYDNQLHLSGSPVIDSVTITKPDTVSAKHPTSSASYTGSPIKMNISSDLKNGDVLVKNVSSNTVAEKFFFDENETKWKYTEFINNNIVLNILPNGKCGDYAYWGLKNGTLTIYGTGELWTNLSGDRYPWSAYIDEITNIVVEDGITSIPEYTFEYCENVKTITLPETLTSLKLNAFNDCGSLNNLLLPSSLKTVTGATDVLGFIRCESLTDVYYLGTVDEWYSMTGGKNLYSYDSSMTVNYLKFHEATRTCTTSGTDAYYRFDNISVFRNYYDENKNVVDIYTKGALGHDMGSWITTEPTCVADGFTRRDCSRCDYFESYTTGTATGNHSYTSVITTHATHLTVGVETFTCECGDSYTKTIEKLPEHNYYANKTINPTCSTEGYTEYVCECGNSYIDDYVDYDYNVHVNEDSNAYCDYCGETLCSHMCHKSGFVGFFWKIINFLQKIFGTGKYCECGAAHY